MLCQQLSSIVNHLNLIMKKIIFCAFSALMVVAVYSFNNRDIKNVDFLKLSSKEQLKMKTDLKADLRKDSIFLMYDALSKLQIEALIGAKHVPGAAKRLKTGGSISSVSDLTANYREMGISNPEQFAKLEIIKRLLLASLVQKHPEFKNMPISTRKEIMVSAKIPLTKEDNLRRDQLMKKAFEENHPKLRNKISEER